MVWEWSHTQEAYDNVRANIAQLEDSERKEIICEIATYHYCLQVEQIRAAALGEEFTQSVCDDVYFNMEFYRDFKTSEKLDEILDGDWVEYIYEFAEEHRTCDNGGFNAHICPFGCHTVPFDLLGEVE